MSGARKTSTNRGIKVTKTGHEEVGYKVNKKSHCAEQNESTNEVESVSSETAINKAEATKDFFSFIIIILINFRIICNT